MYNLFNQNYLRLVQDLQNKRFDFKKELKNKWEKPPQVPGGFNHGPHYYAYVLLQSKYS